MNSINFIKQIQIVEWVFFSPFENTRYNFCLKDEKKNYRIYIKNVFKLTLPCACDKCLVILTLLNSKIRSVVLHKSISIQIFCCVLCVVVNLLCITFTLLSKMESRRNTSIVAIPFLGPVRNFLSDATLITINKELILYRGIWSVVRFISILWAKPKEFLPHGLIFDTW